MFMRFPRTNPANVTFESLAISMPEERAAANDATIGKPT